MNSFVPVFLSVAGIDFSHFESALALIVSICQQLVLGSIYISIGSISFFSSISRLWHIRGLLWNALYGEIPYSAFCQGNQTIRMGRSLLFLII